ncbi:uncharacterized protein EV422DRAFT_195119 [Fimicolochytrium jonesii]|uniref:uncharacterized protein n=1 Tax=Fimicolochytrium jonesii TaxID=1396493 RepID=UPI0022FDF470|nr:uncharacterized protein EV422DRAFT_195119 [Fimicolochytrium jonesii]KAI8818232.1 hypothetical protein EV422DRAFT_195119 [Fimicolochytrium jonesii]
MPLVLSDVPTPRYSDGVTQYYPTVYKAARAPAGGYVECHPSRVRKYLDRLSASLKDIYIRNPTKIPGIQPELLRAGESIVFRGNSGLLEFPKNYKMFESKKPEGLGGGETPGVGTPGGGESPMLGPKEGAGEDPESDAVLTKLEQGDGDGKQAKTPKGESRFRADAFIFGHPSGSKYRSTNEFTPHLEWLVTDDTHDHKNCPCKLCTNFTRSGR